jgi:manganese transport protein
MEATLKLPGADEPRPWARRISYLGPAFLVGVGYIDPGNWATDLEAGSRFGYELLWVVLVSNLIGLVVQSFAARLGMVTGRSLAENCRRHFRPAVRWLIWLSAELALVATDLAEFMGAMLGFKLLFGVGSGVAIVLSVGGAMGILALYRFGNRVVERVIIGLVAVVGSCYVIELLIVHPHWRAVLAGTVIPRLSRQSATIASGILGATVMPHSLFLHSAIVRQEGYAREGARALGPTLFDLFVALNGAWLINAAILVTAAAAFFSRGQVVTSIEQAHATLAPLLGARAAQVFAIGLLAAGIASSTAATLTGQLVFEGFFGKRMNLFLRRGITLAPALLMIIYGADPYLILIVSQVALSVLIPFALVPLIVLSGKRAVMGEQANGALGNALAIAATGLVLYFNAALLFSLLA